MAEYCDVCNREGLEGEIQQAYEDGPDMCAECYMAWEDEYGAWEWSEEGLTSG